MYLSPGGGSNPASSQRPDRARGRERQRVREEYDSNPAAGQDRTDTAYILGVGINF
jgi:hypothetical protein